MMATAEVQAIVGRVPPGAPAVGTIVNSLPPGCAQTSLNGVEYQR